MTTKHTPGPWYIRRCDDSSSMNMTAISTQDWGPHNNSWFNNEPDTIAIVFHQLLPQVSCEIDDLGDANAALIAAAPELLEALQTIENWLSVSFVTTPQDMAQSFEKMYWIARHAIAKAKGQAE